MFKKITILNFRGTWIWNCFFKRHCYSRERTLVGNGYDL